MDFAYIGTIILLILGFGFVVFWHELGHFLAAKWAGVKVEQFAIGFGHAICSWRQGMGMRWGSSNREYEQMLRSDFAGARVGETEYRINWLPLGGYVKMLGQDDLKPNAGVDDPRSYTSKSIGARMVIVSAGVVMNVILAAILFMALFLMGFRAPPALVGGMLSGSPAQLAVRPDGTPAPLQVGDRILYFDDKYQHDFTKITLAVALAGPGQTLAYVERRDGSRERLLLAPAKRPDDPHGFLMLGVSPAPELKGKLTEQDLRLFDDSPVRPGEVVVSVAGQPVVVGQKDRYDYWKLDEAVQQSFGKPVPIVVRDADGREHQREVRPQFTPTFTGAVNIAGLLPRAAVEGVMDESPAQGKLRPGDAIVGITTQPHRDSVENPSFERLTKLFDESGRNERAVDVDVLRDGQVVTISGLTPNLKLESKRRGLGIELMVDTDHPVVADVLPDSPAGKAGVPRGAAIRSVAAQPVQTWFDLHRLLAAAGVDAPVELELTTREGTAKTITMRLTAAQLADVQLIRYEPNVRLGERIEPRKTNNPAVAAAWGVTETRDLIIQFYLTIKRMVQGSVSPTSLMGPFGIVHAGSRIAYKGNDWLLWFLAMISANLAVVNFLPIPIVDGGLFMFLILEKIMGRPLSPRAQSIAQVVGLALILSVFIFVTYQDITRMF